MPSGTATKSSVDQASDVNCRDALDGLIDRALKRNSRKRTSRPALPLAALPEEKLLQYVDGALHLSSHQEVEQHLLFDPEARGRVATLSSALSEVYGGPSAKESEPGRPARYLFLYTGGVLRFLRGTDLPLEPAGTPPADRRPGPLPSFSPSWFSSSPAFSSAALSSPPTPSQPSPPRQLPCFDFLHDFGPFSSHLRIESSSSGALDLQLVLRGPIPNCEVHLLRGPQLVSSGSPDGEGRVAFRGLGAARHAVEIYSDRAIAAKVVIDIRGE